MAYWLERFGGDIPVLDLPGDYPRAPDMDPRAAFYRFYIEGEVAREFRALSREIDATLFMHLLTVLYVLLFKYTGQKDIIVGTALSGRPHPHLQQVMGMFVNSLPLRHFPEKEKEYVQFLKEVKENCINAFDNQDIQFEELVDRLPVKRDRSNNPLFDVMLVLQNFEHTTNYIKGVKALPRDVVVKNARFDLSFQVAESGERLLINIDYPASLFKPAAIETMALHFTDIICQVVANKYIKLKDITIGRELVDPQAVDLEDEEGDFHF